NRGRVRCTYLTITPHDNSRWWTQPTVCLTSGKRSFVSEQIRLRKIKLVHKFVLDNIVFIDVVLSPKAGTSVADIAHLGNSVLVQLSLIPDRPGMDATRFEIWVKDVCRVVYTRNDRVSDGHGSRCETVGDQIAQ